VLIIDLYSLADATDVGTPYLGLSLTHNKQRISEANNMTTELNQLLPDSAGEKAQIWIIGTRDQIIHLINEFYVKQIANDRIKFTPIVPAPFAKGKYMTVLER
jgi:hypothetical protein